MSSSVLAEGLAPLAAGFSTGDPVPLRGRPRLKTAAAHGPEEDSLGHARAV